MECLWLCFSALIQKVLNEVKEHWNTHLIRKSRHDTVNGRQDSLFYLPEIRGGTQFLLPTTEADRQYAHCHIVETEEHNDYQECFQYVQKCVPWSSLMIGETHCSFTSSLCSMHAMGKSECILQGQNDHCMTSISVELECLYDMQI